MDDKYTQKLDTSVVTKKTWKTIDYIPTDPAVVKTFPEKTFKDRVVYLALRGWRVELETRGGNEYFYAIKYIDRKKRRIYLGKSEDRPDLWKTQSSSPTTVVDFELLISFNFKDKIYYLAIFGWRIEIETHNGEESIIAVKYIDLKKRKIRLGKKEDSPDIEKIDLK